VQFAKVIIILAGSYFGSSRKTIDIQGTGIKAFGVNIDKDLSDAYLRSTTDQDLIPVTVLPGSLSSAI